MVSEQVDPLSMSTMEGRVEVLKKDVPTMEQLSECIKEIRAMLLSGQVLPKLQRVETLRT